MSLLDVVGRVDNLSLFQCTLLFSVPWIAFSWCMVSRSCIVSNIIVTIFQPWTGLLFKYDSFKKCLMNITEYHFFNKRIPGLRSRTGRIHKFPNSLALLLDNIEMLETSELFLVMFYHYGHHYNCSVSLVSTRLWSLKEWWTTSVFYTHYLIIRSEVDINYKNFTIIGVILVGFVTIWSRHFRKSIYKVIFQIITV